jgi:hypothetical protein
MSSFSNISLYFGDASLSKLAAAALEGWARYYYFNAEEIQAG